MSDPRTYLDSVLERAEAADNGPWFLSPNADDPVWSAVVTGGVDEHDNDQPPFIEAGSRRNAEFIAHARTDVPRIAEALKAVLDLHQLDTDDVACGNLRHTNTDVGCPECYHPCQRCYEPYPCPTVQAITETLGGNLE